MIRYLLCVGLAVMMWACVEPFEPEVRAYEETLVVDGLLTDSDQPAVVSLSRSFAFDEESAQAVFGASVQIEEEGGNTIELMERDSGLYVSDPDQFRGQAGKRYRLLLRLRDQSHYESDWELLKPAPPVEEISWVEEEQIPDDPNGLPIRGLKFMVTSEDREGDTQFYRWIWEETYEYINPKPPFIQVEFPDDDPDSARFRETPPEEFAGFRCYKSLVSRRILISETEGLSRDRVDDFPIHFVDLSTPRLYTRYSLLVRQFALGRDYFRFLEKIEQINQSSGSLFDPIPDEVFGNVRSVDGDQPVLGYFGVAGQASKRIFVNREDLPLGFTAPPSPLCQEDTVQLGDFERLHLLLQRPDQVFHNYELNFIGIPIGYLLTSRPCSFCEDNGATNVVPDYW